MTIQALTLTKADHTGPISTLLSGMQRGRVARGTVRPAARRSTSARKAQAFARIEDSLLNDLADRAAMLSQKATA